MVGTAAVGVAAGAGAGAWAEAADSSGVPKSGSSPRGPLVALMPGAGFVAGTSGGGAKSAGEGAEASVVLASVASGSVAVGAADSWAAVAVGGAGTVAPAGSGAGVGTGQYTVRKIKSSRKGIIGRHGVVSCVKS